MSDLPEEVLADILSRLPVKPLIRFKCVSTPWRFLIESSNFVKLHLDRSIKTKTNLSLILRENNLYGVDFDSLDGAGEAEMVDAEKLDHHPLRCQDYGTEVWGSCNGLLCLSNALDTLVLWNPSTRASRRLPYTSIEFQNQSRYHESRVYGFGYDRVSDDYKLVRIVVLKCKDDVSFHYEVKVYSVKSNSWHRAEKFPHYANLKRTGGILAGGALHWVVAQETESGKANLIVAFDLESEQYSFVPQPDYGDASFYMYVEGLGGCLSVVCNYYLARVDVWVMKDYGVKESWTKILSVRQPNVSRSFQYVRPVAYSKSGGEVLLEQDTLRLLWYDIEKKTVRNFKIHGIKDFLQVELYLASLVPLNNVGQGDGREHQEQEEKNMDNFLSKGFKLVL